MLEISNCGNQNDSNVVPLGISLRHTNSNNYLLVDGGLNFYSKKKSIREEMQCVTSYFLDFKPTHITTPFQGASLLISQDKSRFYFCSKEGRIATALIEKKEIIQDIDLKEGPIRTIALYQNDKFLFSGGHSGAIKKFLLEDLSVVDTLLGHTSEIEAIVISTDETTMYSIGEDGIVFKWDLLESQIAPVQLYSHSGLGCGLDLSADNNYLASCGGDRSVTVFNTFTLEIIETIQENDFGVIWCVKITENNLFIIFGDAFGKVYLYKFQTFERVAVLHGHEDKVRCMIEFLNERYIITGGSDYKIVVWDIIELKEVLSLKGHTDGVKSLMVSQDNSFLYSMSDDCTIRTWKIPNFNHYRSLIMRVDRYGVEKLQMAKQKSNEIIIFTKQALFTYDTNTQMESQLESFNSHIVCYDFSAKSDTLCLISTRKIIKKQSGKQKLTLKSYDISIYDITTKDYKNSHKLESYGIYSVLISPDEKFIIIGEIYHCTILDSETFEFFNIFRSHKHKIVSLAISQDNSTMYSGDASGVIKSFDFYGKYEIKTLNSHGSKIMKISVTSDNEYMVSIHKDFVIDIWASWKMIKVNSISVENALDFVLLQDTSKMMVFHKNFVKCFIVPSMVVAFCMSFDIETLNCCLSTDEESILAYRGNKIAVYVNPLKSQEVRAYGDLENLHVFHEEVGKLVNGKLDKHKSILNNWIIQPFNVNIMHLYAYLDKHKFLKQCFEENVGFFQSRAGYTALDICLKSKSEKCLDFLYEELEKAIIKNPLILSALENSLARINKCPYSNAHKFYNLAFPKSIDSRLPKFCQARKKLPVVVLTPQLLVRKGIFLDISEYSNEGTAITFRQTYFRLSMAPGSRKSLKFINSILKSENTLLFTSEFIELVLNEKWKKVRILLYFQFLVYMGYLFSLSYYAITQDSSIIACFILSNCLIAYEIWQFICGGMDYLSDLWNYSDIFRAITMTLLFFQNSFKLFEEQNLLAIVLGISWFRGLSYFRLLKNTRYYVNLIYVVCLDIIPFLTILFYSTLAFSIVFRVLMKNDDSEFYYLTNSWEINVGGFDTTGYNKPMYLAFFLHTLCNPIIMLNLLISIMSNTFQKVNDLSVIADGKELASMIREGELLFFFNRNKNQKQFIHMCSVSTGNDKSENHEHQELKEEVSAIKTIQEGLLSEISEMKQDIKQILFYLKKQE